MEAGQVVRSDFKNPFVKSKNVINNFSVHLKEYKMTIKHTPGPWHHTGREFNDVRDSDDELVAVALHLRVGQPERSVQEAAANARLIAAAPDLLNALRDMVDAATGRLDGETVALHNALVVIAKATGEKA
jgi:hypothetical protein